jgi:hypothetical protein
VSAAGASEATNVSRTTTTITNRLMLPFHAGLTKIAAISQIAYRYLYSSHRR